MRGLRSLALALLLLAATLVVLPGPVAASVVVTTCANSGAGSLPDAVAHAAANDTIVFNRDCPQATPITLAATITIGVNMTIDATVASHNVVVDGGNAVGMFAVSGDVTATLSGLTIQHGNTAYGGGVFNAGTTTVTNSTINGNAATQGGGLYNNGTLTVTNSAISCNSADSGGGIYDNVGTVTVTNSTISGNSASITYGGGIHNGSRSTISVTNSTISGNSSSFAGGGIENDNALTATNTIIAGNTAAAAGGGPDYKGGVASGGHNLVGMTDSSSGWGASDLTGTAASPLDPLLAPLADNGGPTQTIALLPGSPALGAGDGSVCRQGGAGAVNGLDQRGLPRLASTCGIGAYQLQDTHLSVGSSGGPAGTSVALVVALLDGYGHLLAPYTGTIHFTSSDPLAMLPADETFTGTGSGADNGVRASTVTFRTAGTQTITATDTLAGTLTNGDAAAIAPVVASVSPSSGATTGGGRATISGIGFGTLPANVGVTIGGTSATVVGATSTQLVVIAPAHTAGVVGVAVTVGGQSATMTDGYTYGVVDALPGAAPTGGAPGIPAPRPSPQPTGGAPGNPSPLPPPRP